MIINETLLLITENAIVVSSILILTLGLGLVALRSSRVTKQVSALANEVARLEDLLHAQSTGMNGMGDSLQHLHAQHQALFYQLEQLEQVGPFVGDVPVASGPQVYSQAINLAVDGIEPKELTERFGLSRGEAELMVSFHQLGDRAA